MGRATNVLAQQHTGTCARPLSPCFNGILRNLSRYTFHQSFYGKYLELSGFFREHTSSEA